MPQFDFSIIRTLRKKRGLTAGELARRADLTRATVAKMEAGDGNPTIETIDALSGVFQLTPSELIRMAEASRCELAEPRPIKTDSFEGILVRFPNFEAYHLKAEAGVRKESDPRYHEDTDEICLVLSGRIKAVVGGRPHELGPGMALRFRALQEHHFDVVDRAEFILIHPGLF